MAKKNYLSKTEQEVYTLLRKDSGRVKTSEDLHVLFPSYNKFKLNNITSSLVRKGYLYRIMRGKYLVQDEASTKPLITNMFGIAQDIHPGYLAFSTALRIYNLIEYEPTTIYVATTSVSEQIKIGEYVLKYVSLGRRATGETHYQGYYVSTKTKTFYDCFHKPQYVGYSTLTKALYLNNGCDWKKFLKYFKEYGSDGLCQRTGYILDLMKNKIGMNVPEYLMKYFRTRIKTKIRLNPRDRRAGTYKKEWRIMDNIGEENILSWW